MIDSTSPTGTSPKASGPAGAALEVKIGAQYLLAMLCGAPGRGLPDVVIDSVRFQRGDEGHPLDDVIVTGTDAKGYQHTLEIQVKLKARFTPKDSVFAAVVAQLATALSNLDLEDDGRRRFAIAVDHASRPRSEAAQQVLRWTRELENAAVFFARMSRTGVANPHMREFVEAFRTHLESSTGGPVADEDVHALLARFQVLIHDFDAGDDSIWLQHVLDRARQTLAPSEASQANALWTFLVDYALNLDSAGTGTDRATLREYVANKGGFTLRGDDQNHEARVAIAEASRQALNALPRTIAGVTLTRTSAIEAITRAQRNARYIEIRGEPGVGKSGLLTALATVMLDEGNAIVLEPNRTPGQGWAAFRQRFGLVGSARELLSDLACAGGTTLFVDNLDGFVEEAVRHTINDLVRAAAKTPGVVVIATARTAVSGDSEPWLDVAALDTLGRAEPVTIDELDESEVEQLRRDAPMLEALLDDRHPARKLTRNLFRLSRLVRDPVSAASLRSEVDMARQWWSSGGDARGGDRRERTRLLAELAERTLDGRVPAPSNAATGTIEPLKAAGSVREVRRDVFVFGHDTLRDWAVGHVLDENAERLAEVVARRKLLPDTLERGVEIAARFALENEGPEAWITMLERIEEVGGHVSWCRPVLLAIGRAEDARALLERATPTLLADDGQRLGELLRVSIATDSRVLELPTIGEKESVPEKVLPDGLVGPANRSWTALLRWVLDHRHELPHPVLGDVLHFVEQFAAMLLVVRGTLYEGVAHLLADLLMPVAVISEPTVSEHDVSIVHNMQGGEAEVLEPPVLAVPLFCLFANGAPDRAKRYLEGHHDRSVVRTILSTSRGFAQVAASELAEMFIRHVFVNDLDRREQFGEYDYWMTPASPSLGPFLALLEADANIGLDLVRRTVEHACEGQKRHQHVSREDEDGILLECAGRSVQFALPSSYTWARMNAPSPVVQCALMALEAWSHSRVERGESIGEVIDDVLGAEMPVAAYLLVAVDVLLTHLSDVTSELVPFITSPELLWLDRLRFHEESIIDTMAGFSSGLSATEPTGLVQRSDLQKRQSRRRSLEQVLLRVALGPDGEIRDAVVERLSRICGRLGSPARFAGMGDSAVMAAHAREMMERHRWKKQTNNSGTVTVHFEPSPTLQSHIDELRDHFSSTSDERFELELASALSRTDRAPDAVLAKKCLEYARRHSAAEAQREGVLGTTRRAVATAASIAAIDGDDTLIKSANAYLGELFRTILLDAEADAHEDHFGRRPPIESATMGLATLWIRLKDASNRDILLRSAAYADSDNVLSGLIPVIEKIGVMDPRLVTSLLRIGFVRCQNHPHPWPLVPKEEYELEVERINMRRRRRLDTAVNSEIDWLDGQAEEPAWPLFPLSGNTQPKEANSGEGPPDDAFTEMSIRQAASWLSKLGVTADPDGFRARSLVQAYSDWTAIGNGEGRAATDRRANALSMRPWNETYYVTAARTFRTSSDLAIIDRAIRLPDSYFIQMVPTLFYSLDLAYFEESGTNPSLVISARHSVAERLAQTWQWKRAAKPCGDSSIELEAGGAIAALCFCRQQFGGAPKSYLKSQGIDRVDPLLPVIVDQMHSGHVPTLAACMLATLEVSPRYSHVQILLDCTSKWIDALSESADLWTRTDLGRRIAIWLKDIVEVKPALAEDEQLLYNALDILSRLVSKGVSEARTAETGWRTRAFNETSSENP